MTAKKNVEKVQFSIRVPVELNEKLESEARKEMRQKNDQVNLILRKYFEQPESESIKVPASR